MSDIYNPDGKDTIKATAVQYIWGKCNSYVLYHSSLLLRKERTFIWITLCESNMLYQVE